MHMHTITNTQTTEMSVWAAAFDYKSGWISLTVLLQHAQGSEKTAV